MAEERQKCRQGDVSDFLDQIETNTNANDNAGKPLGFGSTIFSAPKRMQIVAPEAVAFAA